MDTNGCIHIAVYHFSEKTQPTDENPIFFILDGHHTHTRNLEVILKTRENNITILCLPPHTTYKLQPLDKCVMSALETFDNEGIRCFLKTHQRPITHYDISEILERAYLNINRRKSFESAGLYPERRDVFFRR